MKYDLVIFDMDGTILDTLEDLSDSVNHALMQHGYPVHTIDEIRGFVGNGIRKLLERSVPHGTNEQKISETHKLFTAYYTQHCTDKTKPYEGVTELLEHLHSVGIKTAVVSNKADYAVQRLCEQYFSGLFDAAAGEQMPVYPKKPAPEMVNMIIDKLGAEKNRTVYVGDSDVDIMTAANAGIDMIAVDWGFRDRDFLIENGAGTIVSDVGTLKNIISGASEKNLCFRKGDMSDFNEIHSLINAAVKNMISLGIYQWDEIYPSAEDIIHDIQSGDLYVGEYGNRIAVTYTLNDEYDEQYCNGDWVCNDKPFYVMHRLCVHPDYQNKGIGSNTLIHIESQARNAGACSIRLDAFTENLFALKMYDSLDYKTVGFADFRKGRFHLMEKNLIPENSYETK